MPQLHRICLISRCVHVAPVALGFLLLGTLALMTPHAAHAQPQPLVNAYDLVPAVGVPDIWLTSSVECGRFRCDIAYRIASRLVDRFVKVVWEDANGNPLISATNASLSNFYDPKSFGGLIEATEFSKGVLFAPLGTVPSAVGTADFTGTGSGMPPCGLVYVCHDAEYYYWQNPFSTTPGPGPGSPQGLTLHAAISSAPSAAVPIGAITGTLSNVGVDPSDPGNAPESLSVLFLEFSSTVDSINGLYHYRYSVTNHTDLVIPYAWSDTGLSGLLPAFGVAARAFDSAAAPAIHTSLPSWTLQHPTLSVLRQDFSISLEFFAPGAVPVAVPEPASTWMLGTGLGGLAWWRWRRRQRTA
jgi:hypothetical protein